MKWTIEMSSKESARKTEVKRVTDLLFLYVLPISIHFVAGTGHERHLTFRSQIKKPGLHDHYWRNFRERITETLGQDPRAVPQGGFALRTPART